MCSWILPLMHSQQPPLPLKNQNKKHTQIKNKNQEINYIGFCVGDALPVRRHIFQTKCVENAEIRALAPST